MQYSPFHYFCYLTCQIPSSIQNKNNCGIWATEQRFPFSMFTYLILINRLTLITLIAVSIANFVSKAKEVEVPLWVRYFHLCFPQFFKLGASTKTYAIESVNTWMFILKYFGSKLSYRYNNSGVDWSNIILYRNFNI